VETTTVHQHPAGEQHHVDHSGHGHHPMQQHHFTGMEEQYTASSFGMWVFLVQEIMFFGGLFCAYLVYRNNYPNAFGLASNALRVDLGLFNTIVLIGSSLTMALAVNAAQRSLRGRLIVMLFATMGLGSIFLGVKVIEYSEKFEKREVPGANFCYNPIGTPCRGVSHAPESTLHIIKRYASGGFGQQPAEHGAATEPVARPEHAAPASGPERREDLGQTNRLPVANEASERARSMPGSEIYYSLYFAMTGMHALHMIVGIGLMVWLLYWALKGLYSAEYFTPIENFGLYWHFVDIVWIFLFPLLYLINRHIGEGH
jgi:cytochrome c oxidase subunit III